MDSQNTTILNSALQYLSKGKSVIPVGVNKIPLVPWKEYQSRLPTEQEVTAWWKEYPNANVGIVTGEISGLTVIDVEKGGEWKHFPPTTTIQTGGGGVHLYYSYAPIENKARVFPLTDVRGNGGYIVAPPSIHASGGKYKVLHNYRQMDFPLEMFGEKKATDWGAVTAGGGLGSRNDNASRLVGKLFSAFPKDQWETTVWNLIVAWNKTNNPPLGERELKTTFNSISQRAKHNLPLEDEKLDVKSFTLTEVVELGAKELRETKQEDIVSFGYPWMDERVTGIFKGELVIVGAESGTGKTTWVTNIAHSVSKTKKVTIFALEDRLHEYGIKALYFKIGDIRRKEQEKNYPWNDFRKNAIVDPNYESYLEKAKQELINSNLYFVEANQRMTIEALEQVMEEHLIQGTQLFVIDHLHYFDLLRGNSTKADYIESLMIRLRQFQKRTGARIIMVVHYRKTNNQKPTLDSFKDSISIVQNANYVVNIWRDRSDGANLTKTSFMIPKARNPNGEGTIEVEWDRETNDYKKTTEWTDGTWSQNETTKDEMDIWKLT